jgi:hypothetical protein
MLRRLGLALLTLAVLVGVQAAPAAAEGEPDSGAFNSFTLKASNGYSLTVLGFSEEGYEDGEVLVYAGRGNTAAVYIAPATVTDTRVAANLGRLGRIAVEFRPSRTEGETAPRCTPKAKDSFEGGVYVGKVEFRGEENFTRVSATRARFSLHPFIDWLACGRSVEDEVGQDFPGARLQARTRLARGQLYLRAHQNRAGARVKLSAQINERRGRIWIARGIERTLPAATMKFDPDLESATLRPPSPFSGIGNFRSAEPKNRWTGGLRVDFPGRSNVPLTGSRFTAGLVHARWYEQTPEFRRPSLPGNALRGRKPAG